MVAAAAGEFDGFWVLSPWARRIKQLAMSSSCSSSVSPEFSLAPLPAVVVESGDGGL